VFQRCPSSIQYGVAFYGIAFQELAYFLLNFVKRQMFMTVDSKNSCTKNVPFFWAY